VNVAFLDAWRWKEEGATAARLSVSGGMRPSRSQNVVAELPGSEPESGALFLGGHHDTQAGSAGADDNAAGVAGLIELARVLRPLPRRRTIRLISFGAEEQLSLGSASYVRAHRTELTQSGRLMINFDAYGSWMGWTELVCNGPAELEAYLRPFFSRRGLYPRFLPQVFPYADHFPFVAAGVPGVYVGRPNCSAGRFFHHRPDDDMSRVSTSVVASLLTTAADIMADAAGRDALPFSAGIPEDQNQRVQAFWNDLFGGWEQP
jgi:Zn-dependent M28 family amino/carboxypeptidase